MLDLTQHLPQDDLWMDDYAATMGWEALRGYYDRVFLRLMQMCPGEELHVAREVRPENYDLCINSRIGIDAAVEVIRAAAEAITEAP